RPPAPPLRFVSHPVASLGWARDVSGCRMQESRQSFEKASGSLARATTSGPFPKSFQRRAMWASSSGRSSNPAPHTMPAGARTDARLSSASTTPLELIPRVSPWSRRICAWAAAAVSWSPKKSATSGAYPPRRAEAASARPEAAAISTAVVLPIQLARQLECVAKIEAHWSGGGDHPLEQTKFGLILDIADRKWTDAERAMRGEFRAVRHHVQTFDAGRGNGVHVGHDQKPFRR